MPNDYPYVNKLVDNKALKGLVRDVIEKYTNEEAVVIIDRIKILGFVVGAKRSGNDLSYFLFLYKVGAFL